MERSRRRHRHAAVAGLRPTDTECPLLPVADTRPRISSTGSMQTLDVCRVEAEMFEWIIAFLRQTGALGIALLMFLENLFPPIPSELIMPMAGFAAARGEQSIWVVIGSGSAGSLLGAAFWYWIGRRLGRKGVEELAAKHGRWLTPRTWSGPLTALTDMANPPF